VQFKINTPNLGMVQNWNHCLSLARGEYIKYIFGDDKFDTPQALGKMVAMLDREPGAVMAVSARKLIDENSRWIDTWDHLGDAGLQNGKEAIIRCIVKDHNLIGEPSVVLFRKAGAARGFNLKYRQIVDMEMWFHLLEQGGLVYTRETLCCFRQHPQQQTAVNNANQIGQSERLLLLKDCSKNKWLAEDAPPKTRMSMVYSFRKIPRTPEVQAIKKTYLTGISASTWHFYWLRRKLTRPFENAKKSIHKRVRGGEQSVEIFKKRPK